jgi:hypothetical protein
VSKSELIEQAIDKYRPRPKRPTIIGESFSHSVFDAFFDEFDRAQELFRRRLEGATDEELEFFCTATYLGKNAVYAGENSAVDAYREIEFPSKPQWFSDGFEVEEYMPDYVYWMRRLKWPNGACVALCLGFDPDRYDEVFDWCSANASEAATKFRKLNKLVAEHFKTSGYINLDPSPVEFCKWAQGLKIDLPVNFIEAVNKIHGTTFKPSRLSQKQIKASVEQRERQSLLSLVIGMAKVGYRYDPSKTRNDAVGDIQADLDSCGVGLDSKTVRHYLKEASALLPEINERE